LTQFHGWIKEKLKNLFMESHFKSSSFEAKKRMVYRLLTLGELVIDYGFIMSNGKVRKKDLESNENCFKESNMSGTGDQ
jgi:hypothetical protein